MEANSGGTATAEQTEVERLKEQLRQEHEMYLRALADFDNYRRRVESDRISTVKRGKRELIISLLELSDGFELALKHLQDTPPAIAEGFKAIYRRLQNLLDREGVTPISSVGQAFDPHLHEAIDSVRSDEVAPGTVVEELQRGYRWGDELLRPARVRVAN
ncbi:MAG TPA: nucleotide exchange factor GrpE [Bryobacteraceae bacterium]|jgi:molecular chaperone GrpE|nr:nucleotide exchange factor GrpE [Bryobacteraceae bacterium]